MKQLIIGDIFSKAKDLYVTNIKTLIVPALIIWGVGLAAEMYSGPFSVVDDEQAFEMLPNFLGLLAIVIIVQTVVMLILIRMCLSIVRDTPTSFEQAMPSASLILAYFGTSILFALGVALGFVLLIIPGIIAMVWFAFATYFVADEKAHVFESFSKSQELTKGVRWKVLGLIVLAAVITMIAGIIPFGIATLFTTPFIILMVSLAYNSLLSGLGASSVVGENTGTEPPKELPESPDETDAGSNIPEFHPKQ